MALVRIPTRFEHLLQDPTLDPAPLIVRVDGDLGAIEKLRRATEIQGGGVLGFLAGESGVGKTTSAYSAAALMSDRFRAVLAVPHTVPLRGVASWLSANLPDAEGRCIPVLLDGREVTDDKTGLSQMMAGLNSLLRGRQDVIALWPTTDTVWRDELVALARRVGGRSLVPAAGEIMVSGPPADAWAEVFERLLIRFDQRFDDLGLDQALIDSLAISASEVGGFLESVRDAIAERIDEVQLAKDLPKIVFVVTSDSAIVGEANRLRRAGTLLLKAEELIQYSPRSASGLYWTARQGEPSHNLAYIISLFQSRLTTMTPSSVGYACIEFGDDDLRESAKAAGMGRSPQNGDTTFRSTDFYKFLSGQPRFELTSTNKGRTAESTLNAYKAIQAVSAKRHKAINQAICALADRNVPEFAAGLGQFEVDLGNQGAYADAVIGLGEDELHLEFHHLSPAHCKASSVAAYVMDKLKVYALQYNLIPR